jgi:HK97 gp10 family phage protein
MSFKVNLAQLEALRPGLERFTRAVQEEVALEGVASMARVVYQDARSRAPVSERAHFFYGRNSRKSGVRYLFTPGNLQRAIYRAYSPEQSGNGIQLYRVSWNHQKAPYGHMVEFGTSRAPAHPFLHPALATLPEAMAAGKAAMAKKLTQLEIRRA